jgi:acetolactate synthase-1/2/3 large subunit
MGREDILISDVGSHKLWIARTFPAYEPSSVLISNSLAAMGFALPAAVAAKLVHPSRKVVAVSGDRGFLMNLQEMETAKRLGLAIVNVIFRDGGYNLVQWKQQTRLGRESGVEYTNPDFKGFRVEAARGLAPVLAEALAWPLHRGRAGGLSGESEADRAPRSPRLSDLTARALLRSRP